MEYSLTLDDINKLSDLGFDMRGVAPGELAEMEEMVALGIDTRLPEEQPEIDTNSILPPINEEIDVPARVDTPQPAGTGAMNSQMQQLLDLIKSQQAAAAKPASQELSKTQKRMLAFAGIADAGRALQGKEGTNVQNLMARFTDLADQRRKAEAAQAQRSLVSSMIGGTGGMGAVSNVSALTNPDEIRNAISNLTNMLAVYPSLEPFIKLQVDNLYKRLEQIETLEEGAASAETSLDIIDALLEQDLSQVSGVKGFFNSIFAEYGLAPRYTNINSLVDQLDGLNFLEIFQKLKGGGQITENETKQGKAAQSRIRSVLGGSEADIRAAIKEVQLYFNDAIRKNPTYKDAKNRTEELKKKWLPSG
jgi:hypothetical protein